MRMILYTLMVSSLIYPQQIKTQFFSAQERLMIQSVSLRDSVPYPMIHSMMLCEGVTDSAKIVATLELFNDHMEDLDQRIQKKTSTSQKVKLIIDYMRAQYCKTYNEFALTEQLFKDGNYSNVTAAGLFYDICSRYRIPIRVNNTSVHVYFSFVEENDTIRVEPCYVKGYDTGEDVKNVRSIIEICNSSGSRFIDQKEMLRITQEYRAFRTVAPSYIVGLRYAVDGHSFFESADYTRSFLSYEKAVLTIRDYHTFQSHYANAFYMFSGEEAKVKDHYFTLFERFLLNLGANDAIVENNLTRIERYTVYMRESRDYMRAQTMLDHVLNRTGEAELRKKIAEIITKHAFFWAYNLYELGDYAAAYTKMQSVVMAESLNQRYIEASLKFATRFATFQIEQGKSARARTILDSVMERYHSIPFVREAYVKSMNSIVYNDNLLRDNPEEAIRILKRANAFDPNNKTMINLLVSAYHNLAMKKVKAKQYKEARALIQEGQRLSPSDPYLKRDMEYLNSQEKKSR